MKSNIVLGGYKLFFAASVTPYDGVAIVMQISSNAQNRDNWVCVFAFERTV